MKHSQNKPETLLVWEKGVMDKVSRQSENHDPQIAHIYNSIENEVIKWSNRGNETAGKLTRKIVHIILKELNPD